MPQGLGCRRPILGVRGDELTDAANDRFVRCVRYGLRYLGTDRRKGRPDLRVYIRYVRRINVVFDQKPKQARGNLLPLPLVADTGLDQRPHVRE
ncbi:hypothetical protein GobsT_37390 [Gemmata obscuriglobus]|uniref:Uncharacterized protein n=1 Tax=Gemmata obscuriglobus TaxID=114 RepID=A0A2Z3HAI9_9BACT|nr:hypothetical protein [Gemmata obscuriglobus]AWM38160.1 hypothetical protein C1280_14965 [Gemmata obscuriglobus]QEG28950.1 hypothetical protein GobsT_37390 [Gemmata obscuriglobus]VTS07475.1 unnamed protein product [Gemmata obscuriglobus UQM 2246]